MALHTGASRLVDTMMRLRFIVLLVVLGAVIGDGSNAAALHASHWTISSLGSTEYSRATGINAAGQVVGPGFVWHDGKSIDLGSGQAVLINDRGQIVINDNGHARLWEEGKTTDLGALGPYRTVATAINNRGQIVGWSATKARRPHAFLWQNGAMTDLGRHGWAVSSAVGINNAGQVIGWRARRSNSSDAQKHALLWQNGREIDLGRIGERGGSVPRAIDERGQVVERSGPNSLAAHGFLWQAGKLRDIGTLGGKESEATAMNDHGQIVGFSDIANSSDSDWHGFLWQHGTMTDLGTLGGWYSEPVAINERGTVIGVANMHDDPDADHAFVWQDGKITDLGTLIGQRGRSGAVAINNRDQIVGWSLGEDGATHAVLWTLEAGS